MNIDIITPKEVALIKARILKLAVRLKSLKEELEICDAELSLLIESVDTMEDKNQMSFDIGDTN